MKKIHPLITKEQERWKRWTTEIELLNDTLFKVEDLSHCLLEIEGVEKTAYLVAINYVSLLINLNHPVIMALCLPVLMDTLGSITLENIRPEKKEFKYTFGGYANNDKVDVDFYLIGDSCKLVKTGVELKSIPTYELQCNGEVVYAKATTDLSRKV